MASTTNRARTIAAAVVGILAVPVIVAALVAGWARATVFSTSEVVVLSRAALDEPDVQDGLAAWLTDEIFANVEIDARLDEILPADLDRVSSIIDEAARRAIERALTRAFANPDVQRVMSNVIGVAHHRAMDLLQGNGLADGLAVDDGEVSVNFLPLLARAMAALQDLGVLSNVDVPTLPEGSDPPEQIAAFEAATGRDLPDDFGQLVVYRSDAVAEGEQFLDGVQRVAAIARRGFWLLIALAIGLPIAAVALAHDRVRARLWLALGILVSMVLLRGAVDRIVDQGPDVARTAAGRSAVSAILDGASTSLLRLTGAVLVGAAVVAALAIVRRRHFVEDVALAAGVLAAAITVAVVGLYLGGLVVAALLAVGVWLIVRSRLARELHPAGVGPVAETRPVP
jgi:hypothetical protein